MQHPQNDDTLVALNLIDNHVRKSSHDEFVRIRHTSRSTEIGMGDQVCSRIENAPSDTRGGLRVSGFNPLTMPRKSSLAGSVHRNRLMRGGQ
jgi:hypothetical protein